MAVKNYTTAQKAWIELASKRLTKMTFPLTAVFIYSLVCLIIYGNSGNNYLFMVIGSVVSIAISLIFVVSILKYSANGRKDFTAIFIKDTSYVLTAIVWLFGCYLVFYQGFWGLKELSHGLVIWEIAKAVISVILGFVVVSQIFGLTEDADKLKKVIKLSD